MRRHPFIWLISAIAAFAAVWMFRAAIELLKDRVVSFTNARLTEWFGADVSEWWAIVIAAPFLFGVIGVLLLALIAATWIAARQTYYINPREPLRIEFEDVGMIEDESTLTQVFDRDGSLISPPPLKNFVFCIWVHNISTRTVENVTVQVGPDTLFPSDITRLLVPVGKSENDAVVAIHPKERVRYRILSMRHPGDNQAEAEAGYIITQHFASDIPKEEGQKFVITVRGNDCDPEIAYLTIDAASTPKVTMKRRAGMTRRERAALDAELLGLR